MEPSTVSRIAVLMLAGVTACGSVASARQAAEFGPVYVQTIPEGYRDWKFISVAREEGANEDVHAILTWYVP